MLPRNSQPKYFHPAENPQTTLIQDKPLYTSHKYWLFSFNMNHGCSKALDLGKVSLNLLLSIFLSPTFIPLGIFCHESLHHFLASSSLLVIALNEAEPDMAMKLTYLGCVYSQMLRCSSPIAWIHVRSTDQIGRGAGLDSRLTGSTTHFCRLDLPQGVRQGSAESKP